MESHFGMLSDVGRMQKLLRYEARWNETSASSITSWTYDRHQGGTRVDG